MGRTLLCASGQVGEVGEVVSGQDCRGAPVCVEQTV